MGFVASITIEFLGKGGHVRSNLPGFPNGVPLNRSDIEGATVKTRATKVMLFDEFDNALPTPIRATSRPLDSDAPPGLDNSGSKGYERLPNATKQRIMFADSSSTPRQLDIDVLPGAAPRTGHRGPQKGEGTVDSVLSFTETTGGGDIVVLGETNDIASFGGRGGLT